MVPSTWLAVVLFVVVVAPGLWFELLSEKRKVGVTESVFREASRVVLSSLLFGTVAVSILALIRAIEPHWMPDPRLLLRAKSGYSASHYRLVARSLLLEAGLSFSAVWLTHCWLTGRAGGTSIRPVSAWSRTMRHEVLPGVEPAVWVVMEDGKQWIGLVHDFSANLETEGRELILSPPLYSNGGDGFTQVDDKWQRVVLNGGSIKALSVQYWLKSSDNQQVSLGKARRFRAWCRRRWQWVRARPAPR